MKSKRQFHSLTALKGLFILIIVFHNTLSIQPLFDSVPGSSFIILFGGILGNSMFFILSGFLFAYSYRERISMHTISFKDFLFRRLQKLYPLYLITNACALVISVARYGVSAINLTKIAFTLLLQAGGGLTNGGPYNSPTWFVSALFVCYIAFFFISYYAKNTTQYCCAIAFCIIWGYTLLLSDLSIPFCYPGNGTAFLNFFIGCGLAELYPLIDEKIHKWLKPVSIFSLAASGYLLLRYGVEIICGNINAAFSFVICPLILYLALADGVCSKLLQLKPLVYLGKISSSIFFWHLVVYFAFCDLFHLVIGGELRELQYMLYVVLTVAFSAISSKLIETKTLQHTYRSLH